MFVNVWEAYNILFNTMKFVVYACSQIVISSLSNYNGSAFPYTWSAPGVQFYTVVIPKCVSKPMLSLLLLLWVQKIYFFYPFTVRAQLPPILAVLDDVPVRLVLALFSGFHTKANSPGSIPSWFYQLSKDHLQHVHTFQRKGWGKHGSMLSSLKLKNQN